MKHLPNTNQINTLLAAVFCAGRIILDLRDQGFSHNVKDDGSPVTEADQQAEAILLAALRTQFPDIALVAEEAAAAGKTPKTSDTFFLVDPLDGTKEFVRGGTDFTVNIGLIHQGVPVFGIVYAPVDGRLFVGKEGEPAWQANVNCRDQNPQITKRQALQVRAVDMLDLVAVASRSHRDAQTNDWLAKQKITQIVSAGSSIKFCLLAAGEADVYPRFSPTMEWDTAAAHAVLVAAGGKVTTLSGTDFSYGKTEQAQPYLNPGFIAWGGWQL